MRRQNYCAPSIGILQIDAHDMITTSTVTDVDKIDTRSDDVQNDQFD